MKTSDATRLLIAMAADHGFTKQEVYDKKDQRKPLVRCRRDIAELLRKMGLDHSEIGRVMNRTHAAITYLIGKSNATIKLERSREAEAERRLDELSPGWRQSGDGADYMAAW